MGKARWSQQSRGGQDGSDKPRPVGEPYNPAPPPALEALAS